MADIVLRDHAGRPIGRIQTAPNGRQTLREGQGERILGYFDPADNTTRDLNNHIVGRGNLLAMLLR